LDHLYVLVSKARATTDVAKRALDQTFEVLARSVGLGGNAYGVAGSRDERAEADETLELLRALARMDAARPPAQVSDAARRALREVQRVRESEGVGVIEERRLTLLGRVAAQMRGAGAKPN
ncbi:hypothetical protein C0991_004394, partial [Blastosporella zonata]